MQKRIAKLKTRRGQQTISQANEDEKHVEPASSEVTANLQIPEAWNTSIDEAAVGKFVVLEVVYSKPKRRGISVAQVCAHAHFVVIIDDRY